MKLLKHLYPYLHIASIILMNDKFLVIGTTIMMKPLKGSISLLDVKTMKFMNEVENKERKHFVI